MNENAKRQTGRTHRMLNEAFRAAYGGQRVVVVLSTPRMVDYCVPHLQDLGAKRNGKHGMKVGEDGFITFIDMKSDCVDIGTMRVRGWRHDAVFFDHDVWYQLYGRFIDEYQRHDSNNK